MDINKVNQYCQFCLQEQIAEIPLVVFSKDLRENFEELTQKKPNITLFSQFICMQCFLEFESVVAYRAALLANQNALEDLFTKSISTFVEITPDDIEEQREIQTKEHFEEGMDVTANDQEFADADTSLKDLPMTLDRFDGIDDSSLSKGKNLQHPMACPKCDRQFHSKVDFEFHYEDVHIDDIEESEEICPFCGKVFNNSYRLDHHLVIHQTNVEKKVKVDDQEQLNFSEDLNQHKRVNGNIEHSKVRYCCDFCAADFSRKEILKEHLMKCVTRDSVTRRRRETLDEKKTKKKRIYMCFKGRCDKKFYSRESFSIHLEKAHKMKFQKPFVKSQLSIDSSGDNSDRRFHENSKEKKINFNYICEFCKIRFRTDASLQNHIKYLHKLDDDAFVCLEFECEARFKFAEHLREHQLYKHPEESWPGQRGELNDVMRLQTNPKFFSCWQCDHVCKTSSSLRQHMKLVHDEESIYYCKACQKTFMYNADLIQHIMEHKTTTFILTGETLEGNEL